MGSISGTSEIVELNEDSDVVYHCRGLHTSSNKSKIDNKAGKNMLSMPKNYSVEDDINKLIEAIDLKTLSKGVGSPNQLGVGSPRKNPQKRPTRVGMPQASGIGISESVTLKQALRGLCISQASEMASMKRLSKLAGLSGALEAGTIKRMYRAVVIEAGETVLPHNEEKGSLVEISIVPEAGTMNPSEKSTEYSKLPMKESANGSTVSSPCAVASTTKLMKTKASSQDVIAPISTDMAGEASTFGSRVEEKLNSEHSTSSSKTGTKVSTSSACPREIKPFCKKKSFIKKKMKENLTLSSGSTDAHAQVNLVNMGTPAERLDCQTVKSNTGKESVPPATSMASLSGGLGSKNENFNASKPAIASNKERTSMKTSESSRTKDQGECSQSSKSSIGENSSSTSISEESSISGSSFHGNRPHMSKDSRWEAIHHIEKQHASIGLRNFKLLKKLGSGDIGTVYLAELTGTRCMFALKVMDNDFLARRKKLPRAQTEREIMQMLDHPFLPTLYTHFTTNKFSCLVMEYCPGGDLHVLRQRQPSKSFSEQAARFYTAEVLLALEYLHMLGVVYRDLKPENILVREDGHIMLSDFDLSLRCAVNPTLLKLSPPNVESGKRLAGPCADSDCIDPFCLQPSWVQMPCFTPRLISTAAKTRKLKTDLASQVSPLPQLVAEPTSARSNSFVGTHEYLAPEIIKGEGHGSAVDWWTYGIFLYELLFGRTPFKGSGNEDTLANVVRQSLKFPESPLVSSLARDLIRGLLIKEPENRLGSFRGATEIKQHPFFEGLNWALIRCALPPEIPKIGDAGIPSGSCQKKDSKCFMFGTNEEHLEFEMF